MRFRQQSFQQRCFLLPLISDWTMVFIINTLVFQTVIKIHLCFQPFHVHGSFQRHVYLQKGTPMAVLFKFQPKKKAIVTGIVLLERFSQESSWNYAWVCVCLFEWLTLCEDVGNACAAMAQQSFVVFVPLWDGEMDICWRTMGKVGLFCLSLKGRVRRTDLGLLSPLANVFTAVFSYFHMQWV